MIESMNIAWWVQRWSELHPRKVAVVFEGESVTYEDLHERVNQTGCWLQSLGIEKGDRVAVMLNNGLEFLELYLACARLGAIFVPINFRLTEHELRYLLGNARPRLFVFGRKVAAKAGIQRNDILLKAGDQVLAKEEDLRSELRNHEAGASLNIEYLRKGQRGMATVTVGEADEGNDRQAGAEGGGGEGGRDEKTSIEVMINGKPMMDHLLDDPNMPDMEQGNVAEIESAIGRISERFLSEQGLPPKVTQLGGELARTATRDMIDRFRSELQRRFKTSK